MKHYYLYYAEYLKFNENTNELERRDKYLSKEIPLKQFVKTVIITVLITLLVCTLFTVLASLSLLENDNNIIPGLWVFGIISYALGALFCFVRLFDYDYRVQNYESALIDKLFSEEIKELELLSTQEQIKAEKWRATHPLEEKCRLAITKNPNYVADLIKYVKEYNNNHNDTCQYCGSKDLDVQTAKHYNPIEMTTEEYHRIKCCNCGKILSQDYEENNK